MMLLPCRWCGLRPQTEFEYGGDASRQRPQEGAPLESWLDYVYLRENPCGAHREHWHHVAGCGLWSEVRRDTLTHRVVEGGAGR